MNPHFQKIGDVFLNISKIWAGGWVVIIVASFLINSDSDFIQNFSILDFFIFLTLAFSPYIIIKIIKIGMENKIINNQAKKYWLVLIFILIFGVIFYWFEYRPSQARKQCSAKSFSDNLYKKCLREKGLEK
ncbi:MAG: hypothetical protein WC737_03025 [Parcubacteria group bacterium]|jgi:hypothetical protein